MLVNTPNPSNQQNQPLKFSTKNWVKVNDDSSKVYNANTEIGIKTSKLK